MLKFIKSNVCRKTAKERKYNMAEKNNNTVTNRKATLVGNYYERESKIDDDLKALLQRVAELKANKQRTAKKNRQYLALRIFELFFENTELGRIFAYNRGEIFRSDEKVETLLIMFDELAEKIKLDNDTFGLKDVDLSVQDDSEIIPEANENTSDDENEAFDEKNKTSYTQGNAHTSSKDEDDDDDEDDNSSQW